MKLRQLSKSIVALTAWLAGASVAGAASTWTATYSTNAYGIDTMTSTGGITLTASGAYAANGGTYTGQASNQYGINGFAAGAAGNWQVNNASPYTSGSSLQVWTPSTYNGQTINNGIGMASDGSGAPDHAIDNGPSYDANNNPNGLGNTEAVLLSFSSSVVLSSITTGYVNGDSDFSVFEYTGKSAPTLNGANSDLTQSGWALVGNYDGTGGGLGVGVEGYGGTTAINSQGATSSWWLISAYNNAYGSTCSNCQNGGSILQGNDYFKLYQFSGTQTQGGNAPEPASIALVAVGLLGAMVARRRPMPGATLRLGPDAG